MSVARWTGRVVALWLRSMPRSARPTLVTPGRSPTAGSMSWGSARSMKTWSAVRSTRERATSPASRTTSAEPVHDTMTSAAARASGSRAIGTTSPPMRAASATPRACVRLATATRAAPLRAAVVAASDAIDPAPTTRTEHWVRAPSEPVARAYPASTSDTATASSSVSVCTRFPTRRACWKRVLRAGPARRADCDSRSASRSWARIWLSPTAIESRPLATRKAWAIARSSKCR